MQTLILPGASEHNKEWVENCAEELTVNGIVRPVYWDHWSDPSQTFDPKEKAELIARHSRGDMLNIIAKSVGTLVTSFIINAIPSQINKIVFCGIPLNDINDNEKEIIKNAIKTLKPEQIVCFQNDTDPHGNLTEIKNFLPNDINLIVKVSGDHEYPYYEEFDKFLI
jgi:predicted alpha/beta-hydrolase family hydrolase